MSTLRIYLLVRNTVKNILISQKVSISFYLYPWALSLASSNFLEKLKWISILFTTTCLFCIYHRPCLSIIDKKFYDKSNSIFLCNHNSNEITFYCCRPIISSHCGFSGNNNRIFAEQNIYKSNFINNKKRNGMWIHTFLFWWEKDILNEIFGTLFNASKS